MMSPQRIAQEVVGDELESPAVADPHSCGNSSYSKYHHRPCPRRRDFSTDSIFRDNHPYYNDDDPALDTPPPLSPKHPARQQQHSQCTGWIGSNPNSSNTYWSSSDNCNHNNSNSNSNNSEYNNEQTLAEFIQATRSEYQPYPSRSYEDTWRYGDEASLYSIAEDSREGRLSCETHNNNNSNNNKTKTNEHINNNNNNVCDEEVEAADGVVFDVESNHIDDHHHHCYHHHSSSSSRNNKGENGNGVSRGGHPCSREWESSSVHKTVKTMTGWALRDPNFYDSYVRNNININNNKNVYEEDGTLFSDSDGVLSPSTATKRSNHESPSRQQQLCEKKRRHKIVCVTALVGLCGLAGLVAGLMRLRESPSTSVPTANDADYTHAETDASISQIEQPPVQSPVENANAHVYDTDKNHNHNGNQTTISEDAAQSSIQAFVKSAISICSNPTMLDGDANTTSNQYNAYRAIIHYIQTKSKIDANGSIVIPSHIDNLLVRERFGLLMLYASTEGENWSINTTGWTSNDAPLCEWVGVQGNNGTIKCPSYDNNEEFDDDNHTHKLNGTSNERKKKYQCQVQELMLRAANLVGDIPNEICCLPCLSELDLSMNDLTSVPSCLVDGKNLTSLNLTGNDRLPKDT